MSLLTCVKCGNEMGMVRFLEEEEARNSIDGRYYKTGRVRKAVSHLVCEICGHQECVDDTFDGPWFTPAKKENQYVQNRVSG